MYERIGKKSGAGLPPRMTRRNIPPTGLGWTGGFTIPGQEQRFSGQTCSGPAAEPMDSSSDLICGRSAEVEYLNRIGCRTVGFQGSHHCMTTEGNQGLFFCCPPGTLDQARAGASVASMLPSGIVLGIGALAVVGVGLLVWEHVKQTRSFERSLYVDEEY